MFIGLLPFLYKVLRTLQFQDIPKLVIQSLLGMLGMTFCYFNAVQHVGPAIAVALLYTAPIWSVVLSFIFERANNVKVNDAHSCGCEWCCMYDAW